MFREVLTVHFLQDGAGLTVRPATGKGEFVRWKQIRNRPWRGGLDEGALVAGREKPRTEICLLIVGQAPGIREDDEVREIVRQAAQRIRDPGAEAGKSRQEKAGVHHVAGRTMDIGL